MVEKLTYLSVWQTLNLDPVMMTTLTWAGHYKAKKTQNIKHNFKDWHVNLLILQDYAFTFNTFAWTNLFT